MSNIALQARQVNVALSGAPVLRGVSLSLRAGAWTAVVGPNGAGKSTLLQTLAGLRPCTGEVQLLGQALSTYSHRERARQLSWLGQGEPVADDLTVYQLVMLARLPHQAWLAAPSAADHAAVQQALGAVQAWDWRTRSLGQLSGGERQRVLLARVLAGEAQVLLMDEPLANLDPPHQVDWLRLVRELVSRGRTVVSVLHELSFALQADDLLVLDRGQVLHHGACSDPATHTALAQVFDDRVAVVRFNEHWLAVPRLTA